MSIGTSASVLLAGLLSAPALAAQTTPTPQRATVRSLAGKWNACITDEGRTGCWTYEFKVNGDTLTGKDITPSGREDAMVEVRLQGDHLSFKTGNGCTEKGGRPCSVVVSGTYAGGDQFKLNLDDTDNSRQHTVSLTRVTRKS
jgi:hypothetical protein